VPVHGPIHVGMRVSIEDYAYECKMILVPKVPYFSFGVATDVFLIRSGLTDKSDWPSQQLR
jgi:hypothetical protein